MRAPLCAALAIALAGCAIARYPDDPYEGYYEREYRAAAVDPVPLTAEDTLYRGYDGRYYCRRLDGSMGLVVGPTDLLGEAIVPRRYRTIAEIAAFPGYEGVGAAVQAQELRCA